MPLDGPDFWRNNAREIQVLLYQRWKDCLFRKVHGIPSWTEILSHPDLETLRTLEKRLKASTGKKDTNWIRGSKRAGNPN